MPELPEVETVRRGLQRWVVGRTISRVDVRHPRAVRRHIAGADDFAALLVSRTLDAALRRGKYLWLPLDSGDALVGHLGMSGQLLVENADAPDEPHLRLRVSFADGDPELRFVDQRLFPVHSNTSDVIRWIPNSTRRPSSKGCDGGVPA